PRPPPRGTTRHSRTPVLQDGILQPDGQPQSEHGPRASMVRETGRVRTPHDGDGSGPMGHRAGVRGEPRRPPDDDLLGPRGPRLEDAAPAVHADVRSDGPRFPKSGDGDGTRPPRESPAPSRIPQGEYRYDFADHAELTPMLKMYTLGHRAEMKPVRGDGLRYHGCSPILSLLRHRGLIDTIAYPTDERHVFERARMFVQAEGFLPAPESAYSIACAIDEALKAKETGERTVIAFNVSGHGFMDMEGYADVLGV